MAPKISDEDRQHVIDIWTHLLVSHGMDENRAEEFGTMITDQAIEQQQS